MAFRIGSAAQARHDEFGIPGELDDEGSATGSVDKARGKGLRSFTGKIRHKYSRDILPMSCDGKHRAPRDDRGSISSGPG